MVKLKTLLLEGVYDPGILKGVILTGGPGSGKTSVVRSLFGFSENLRISNLSSTGLKVVNSDVHYEKLLQQHKIPLDLQSLEKDDPSLFAFSQSVLRPRAKSRATSQTNTYMEGRLGIIYDGTSASVPKLTSRAEGLISKGYDVICIFVDTDYEVALQRNNQRDRKVPESIVHELWNSCQQMKQQLKSYFGDNLIVVNNSLPFKDGKLQLSNEVVKTVNRFVREPIKNPIGKQWIELQLKLKAAKAIK